MNKPSMLLMFIFILSWSNIAHDANSFLDEAEFESDLSMSYHAPNSYNRALAIWKTAEDISKWAANSFVYDKARAMRLSANQRTREKVISVYDPPEFFVKKTGICVDLARFGFETLRKIDPNRDPKYLMIEFDPIQKNGKVFRFHWLVSFKQDGMKYFFCDSKRPGYVAGPYNSTEVFITEYEQYRGRKIVAHRELESYQKQRKSQSRKAQVTKSPNKASAADR